METEALRRYGAPVQRGCWRMPPGLRLQGGAGASASHRTESPTLGSPGPPGRLISPGVHSGPNLPGSLKHVRPRRELTQTNAHGFNAQRARGPSIPPRAFVGATMLKYLLLLVMAWLSGIPGAGGLLLLGLYFLVFVYTTRYRGHYGRLSGSEKNSLILKSDVDKYDMRSQWDIIPWPRTAKHVIRKWTWDRIALDTQLKKSVETTSTALTKAYTTLEEYIGKHPTSKIHPYSGTLAVFDSSRRTHTPDQAFALVKKNVGMELGWTDQAICLLGGTFIVCAESYKDDIKEHFKKQNKKEQRMQSKTDAELSRFTWKFGQLVTTLSFPTGLADFIHSALIRISPWDRHAVVQYR